MMVPSDRELAEVELAGVGVGVGAGVEGSLSGDEDAQPLLSGEGRTLPEYGEGAAGVYPLPSSSYSRDGRGWGSKLVFSWIQPVLEKVRSKRFYDGNVRGLDSNSKPSSVRAGTTAVSSTYESTSLTVHCCIEYDRV